MKKYQQLPFFLAFAVIACMLLPGCEDTKLISDGDIFMKAENYEDAITQFEQFVKENPESGQIPNVNEKIAFCLYEWSRIAQRVRKWDVGIRNLERLSTEFRGTPHYADAVRMLPVFYLEYGRRILADGDILRASEYFNRVIERYRGSVQTRDAKAEMLKIGSVAFSADGDVWAMNADGSNLKKLIENAIQADISHQGEQITFIRIKSKTDTRGQLFICDMNGENETMLLKIGVASYPTYSPDGSYIALRKSNFFQLVSPGTGKRFTYELHGFNRIADWSPDASQIIGYDYRKGGNVVVANSDFTQFYVLAKDRNKTCRAAVWDITGSKILYLNEDGINVIDPNGENGSVFFDAKEQNLDMLAMDLSPDGKNIMLLARNTADGTLGFHVLDKEKNVIPIPVDGLDTLNIDPDRISWGKGYIEQTQ